MKKAKLKIVNFQNLGLLVILVGVIYDILIRTTQVPYYLVSEDYITYVFSGVVTVGALGITIFAFILGISDITCLGFTFKEIIRFDNSPLKIDRIFINCLSPIIIGMFALAWDFNTTMSMLLIYTTLNIIDCSKRCKKMILEYKELEKLVRENVEYKINKNELNTIANNIIIWEIELKKSIEVGNEGLQTLYLELLYLIYTAHVHQKDSGIKARIEIMIRNLFPILIKKYGFGRAYSELFYYNNEQVYDTTSAIQYYMNEIQYGSVEYMGALDVATAISGIIYEIESDDENEITDILYAYFVAINSNIVISSELKNKILRHFFSKLCSFNERAKNALSQSNAVKKCFYKGVLQNNNDEERKNLFDIMIYSLYHENEFWGDSLYFNVIASMFRGSFFYIEYELETVKEEHRKKVKETICSGVDTIDNLDIAMNIMIKKHSKEALDYYIKDAFNKDFGELYDYYPKSLTIKSAIWTLESRIEFAYIFYLIVGYEGRLFPIDKYLSDPKILNTKKVDICKAILNLYDYSNETLNQYAQDILYKIQVYLNESYLLPLHYIKENFHLINNKLIKLSETTDINSGQVIDISKIQIKLEQQIQESKEIVFDNTIKLEDADEFQIMPRFNRYYKDEDSYKDIVNRLEININNVISQIIKETFEPIELTFDLTGIQTLLKKLNSSSYNIRSYTFIDDWALGETVRSSEEYKALEKEIRKITFKSYRNIKGYFFLKSELTINVELVSYERNVPTINQCHLYLKTHKIAEGKYRIDDAIYNTQKAVEWVQKNIYVESAKFKLKINGSGLIVKFVYS